jgi:NAD-dependent dihydropyrimidine dehydrogenase PreA subunit
MPRVITNLCLRDSSCVEVCPVDCISPGEPVEEYPTYYIDPDACIDCGACETEVMSAPLETKGFTEVYRGEDRDGEPVQLPATRILKPGEIVDLSGSIEVNASFYSEGPGYSTQK